MTPDPQMPRTAVDVGSRRVSASAESPSDALVLALCVDETAPRQHLRELLAAERSDLAGGPRRRLCEVSTPEDLSGPLLDPDVAAVVISESLLERAQAACPGYPGSWVVLVDPSGPIRRTDQDAGAHCIRIHTMFCSALPTLIDTVLRHRSGERHLESALERMRQQADRLFEAERVAQVGSWVWEAGADALWVSEEFLRNRGRAVEDSAMSLAGFLEGLLPEDAPRLRGLLDRLCGESGSAGIEYRTVRPDGGVRQLRCEAQAECDDSGRVVRLVGTEQDVTELRRSEQALREREEFLQLALDTARVAAWRWDAAAGRVVFSAGAFALLGRSAREGDEVSITDWLRCVHPSDRRGILAALRLLLVEGRALRVIHRLRETDGAERWMEITGGARSAGNQAEFSLTGTIRDVTEHQRDERERLSLQNELRHAAKMEAVGRLAAGAAHDFNNVLTTILGHAQLGRLALATTDGGENPVRGHLDAVEAACRRATSLTRQLLTIGRREPPGLGRIDVHEALAEHETMLRRLVRADIALRVEACAQSSLVAIDRAQFDQILMNLVVNACDAMPDGGDLTIRTRDVPVDAVRVGPAVEEQPTVFFQLGVSDTGTGISPADLERVFEPFFTTKERDKGTGLGLSIIQGIVEQAGGFVTLSSDVGRGTSIEVHLPLSSGECGDPAVPVRLASMVVRGGDETVMVCEDEVEVRKSMAGLLRAQGYRVVEAGDGEEALRLAGELESPPDLLVADVVLTRRNGPQLAQALRERHPQLRVLYISGYGLDELASMGAHGIGSELLRKPFGSADLLKRVRALLDGGVFQA